MGISRDLIATSVTPLLLSWLAQGVVWLPPHPKG